MNDPQNIANECLGGPAIQISASKTKDDLEYRVFRYNNKVCYTVFENLDWSLMDPSRAVINISVENPIQKHMDMGLTF
jgi:hypothetical protein